MAVVSTKKVRVDSEKCQGHNRCYAMAPGMFKVDEYGYATPRGDGALPTQEQVDLAERAVENCPERAIFIVEEDE
jgi:ferredoxin